MEPLRHLPSPTVKTQGLCGAGYPWPSGILMARKPEDVVTCAVCIRKQGELNTTTTQDKGNQP